MFDPVSTPITQHRLRQRQPRVVRRVHPPTAQPFLGRDGRRVHLHHHTTLLPHLHHRRTVLVLPLRHLGPHRAHLHLDQPHHPVPREDLFRGRLHRRGIQLLLAPLALIQRLQRRDRSRHPLLQRRPLLLGVRRRAHDQPTLRPAHF